MSAWAIFLASHLLMRNDDPYTQTQSHKDERGEKVMPNNIRQFMLMVGVFPRFPPFFTEFHTLRPSFKLYEAY